jgi:GT2 family glycosyltransferase
VFEGRVTGIADGAVTGWIGGADEADGWLEAVVHGEGPVGRGRASPAPDGRLHFAIPLPDRLQDGRIRFIDVRPVGSQRPLEGGPVLFDGGLFDQPPAAEALEVGEAAAPESLEGLVEFDPPARLTGWAWAPAEPTRRPRLEILAGGRLVAVIAAEKLRPDLVERGVGDGRYGFEVDLSKLLRRGPHELVVRPSGASEPLPGGRRTVGPFAADGEVDCPGYLDEEPVRARLAGLPFEHLAWDARRIAPGRLTPRLINRLRRERIALMARDPEPVLLLVLPGGPPEAALEIWGLQSHPRCGAALAQEGSAATRRRTREARWVLLARPGDMLHPSSAAVARRFPDADVLTWNRFCAEEPRAGSPGLILRRPRFDSVTARHGALTDTTLAIRGELLARAPEAVLAALCAGRLHPLWFWLGGQTLAFAHHPEALTSSLGAPPGLPRAEVELDEAVYLQALESDGAGLALEHTSADLPFPYVLVPRRRAAKTSVVVCFRGKPDLTLRCIHSLALQKLSGELELVLVDNQSAPADAAAVAEGAVRLLGDWRIKLLGYDAPFSHSAQNNLGVRAATGEVVVICNNDIALKDPALLEQLGAWALQPGVGAVGCRLWDPDRGLGSYGHIVAEPSADPFQPAMRENPDPAYGLHVHAAPGVTLALAAVSRERFLDLGGLDEDRFPIGYNDIELMSRARDAGLTHLYLGHVFAEHPRGSSRTGDNEDLQALWSFEALAHHGAEHLFQLARARLETARPDLKSKVAPRAEAAAPEGAQDTALAAALQAAIQARREVEERRAELARSLARASGQD